MRDCFSITLRDEEVVAYPVTRENMTLLNIETPRSFAPVFFFRFQVRGFLVTFLSF
jgi:hypothetical protein